MKRRWAVFVLALAFAGPLAAPLVASARAGCARCAGAARCCCAPARGPGGCALGRPCGAGSLGDDVAAPQGPEKALPEDSVSARVPPLRPRSIEIDITLEPARTSPVPPDPPPRTAL